MKKWPALMLGIVCCSFNAFAQGEMPVPMVKPTPIQTSSAHSVVAENVETKKVSLSIAQAIAQAVKTSPVLTSANQNVLLAEEGVDFAWSNYRPNINATASVTHLQNNNDVRDEWESDTSKSFGVSLSQPLYRGGRTTAEISEKESLTEEAKMSYRASVDGVVIDSVLAYMNAFEAFESVVVNQNNKKRLKARYNATKAGFDVGELTRTDVAQAEARLSNAEAELIASQAAMDVALSEFYRVTGISEQIAFAYPNLDVSEIPQTLDEALGVAEAKNPVLLAAHQAVGAKEYNIEEQEGAFFPELSLGASLDTTKDPAGGLYEHQDSASVSLNATLPLYQSGILRNQLRQAKIAKDQEIANLETVRRQVRDRVISAWNNYQSIVVQIQARVAQLDAAKIAKEGVVLEQGAGARSILDVLDANQDVRDAELALIRAKSALVKNYYELLGATGLLNSSLWDNL